MKYSARICILLVALVICGPICGCAYSAKTDRTKPKQILIVTGQDYPGHKWKLTAPVLANMFRKDTRLRVHIVEKPIFLASDKLHNYDVVVLHFMDWKQPDPGTKARKNLRKFVNEGKGLFIVHFACGAFQEWPEFRNLAGKVWDPKLKHDPIRKFRVNIIDKKHPITRGLSSFDTVDELYTCLTGERPIRILATARSIVDGKDYPIAFSFSYGKGRVFHSPLGHDVRALDNPNVAELFRRGCAWTAFIPPVQKKQYILHDYSDNKEYWTVHSPPILLPGEKGSFDEIAVKDPSIVHDGERWHLFYTARQSSEYTIGYVSARTLQELQTTRRFELTNIRGTESRYAAAPQVFYFEPQETWYLIYQTKDSNYQPAYSTTKTINAPDSWSNPSNLIEKQEENKWIDFWVICDKTTAYLFYTRDHQALWVQTTRIQDFPQGFGNAQKVYSPIYESVHIYKAIGCNEYHMFYEISGPNGYRHYGLATARSLPGPWKKIADDFATGDQLYYPENSTEWTEEVSHGEMIRSGYTQFLEYDPSESKFLIQGILKAKHVGPYPNLPWKLGIIEKK